MQSFVLFVNITFPSLKKPVKGLLLHVTNGWPKTFNESIIIAKIVQIGIRFSLQIAQPPNMLIILF